jgi:catechol 2,3-dioxygenase-like lactoylglutathione lyase family enzyme
MMKLNHVNLTVTDVAAAAEFLERYFAMRGIPTDHERENFRALFDDDGLVLTLMKTGKPVKYPATFHIGFGQPDEEAVNAMYSRLKADGYDVAPPQRSHAWTFYVNAPGGFTVEVMA